MSVTPLDIIKKQFKSSRKGFDEDEVRAFLNDVRETLVELLNENQRLRDSVQRITNETKHL